MEIRNLDLDVTDMTILRDEARAEGHEFLDRLYDEWSDGRNRFDREREILVGLFDGDALIGVGGLNQDPYVSDPDVGRLRHFYIARNYRRCGLGRALLQKLLAEARGNFRLIRLRSSGQAASHFYASAGFARCFEPDATHVLCR